MSNHQHFHFKAQAHRNVECLGSIKLACDRRQRRLPCLLVGSSNEVSGRPFGKCHSHGHSTGLTRT